MAIHLSLSEEAQAEAKALMLPSRNLCSAAHGEPVIGPTQDMVLGIYYLTASPPDLVSRPVILCQSRETLEQIASSCSSGDLAHDAAVRVSRDVAAEVNDLAAGDSGLLEESSEDEEDGILTTAGRILFYLLAFDGFVAPTPRDIAGGALAELDAAPLVEDAGSAVPDLDDVPLVETAVNA